MLTDLVVITWLRLPSGFKNLQAKHLLVKGVARAEVLVVLVVVQEAADLAAAFKHYYNYNTVFITLSNSSRSNGLAK